MQCPMTVFFSEIPCHRTRDLAIVNGVMWGRSKECAVTALDGGVDNGN